MQYVTELVKWDSYEWSGPYDTPEEAIQDALQIGLDNREYIDYIIHPC